MRKLLPNSHRLVTGLVASGALVVTIGIAGPAAPSVADTRPASGPVAQSIPRPQTPDLSDSVATSNRPPSSAKKANKQSKRGIKAANKACDGYKYRGKQPINRYGNGKYTKYNVGWTRHYAIRGKSTTKWCAATIHSNHTAKQASWYIRVTLARQTDVAYVYRTASSHTASVVKVKGTYNKGTKIVVVGRAAGEYGVDNRGKRYVKRNAESKGLSDK